MFELYQIFQHFTQPIFPNKVLNICSCFSCISFPCSKACPKSRRPRWAPRDPHVCPCVSISNTGRPQVNRTVHGWTDIPVHLSELPRDRTKTKNAHTFMPPSRYDFCISRSKSGRVQREDAAPGSTTFHGTNILRPGIGRRSVDGRARN